jgi:hypothetical protein
MPRCERSPTEKVVSHVRRETQPASIVAELSDGKIQPLDLGERRGRWERLTQNLATLDWVALRCYGKPDADGNAKLIETVPNPAAGAEGEEEEGDDYAPDDPLVQVGRLFDMASKHCERLVQEVRKSDETLEASRSTFMMNLSERNTQLEKLAGDSLMRLQEAVEMIVTIRTESGSNLSDKEQALFGAIDGIGAKLGMWSPGSIKTPQLPLGKTNGSGKATNEGEEA